MVEDEIVDIGQGGEEEADDDAARMPHAACRILHLERRKHRQEINNSISRRENHTCMFQTNFQEGSRVEQVCRESISEIRRRASLSRV